MAGIIGGYIHRAGLVKLGSPFGSKLNHTPDRFIYLATSYHPRNASGQYHRSLLDGGNGGGSVGRLGDDTYYSSMMPEDGKIKFYEIIVDTISIIANVDYHFNIEGVEGLNTISIPNLSSGSFINDTESPFSQGEYLILKMDRSPHTSGGVANGIAFISVVFDA